MATTSLQPARFDLRSLVAHWPAVANREELVASIVVAAGSAVLFAALGGLWLFANVRLVPDLSRLGIAAVAGCLAVLYCTVRFRPVFATTLGFVLALQLGSIFGAATGYLVYSAGAHFPLVDDNLYAIDRAMGFDWAAMLRWFAGYPALVDLTRFAYEQAGPQVGVIFLALLFACQNVRLMKFVTAQFLALVVVHIVAIFLPAVGAYGYLGLTSADHPAMVLTSEGRTVVQVMQLRTGELFDLARAPMMGLITFPSYHTVMALHSAWALWPVRALRWPAVTFNILVWVGTLLHGSHHLIDTIAGAVVAVLCIYAAHRLCALVQPWLFGKGRKRSHA